MRTIKGIDLISTDHYAIVSEVDGSFAIAEEEIEESSVIPGCINYPTALGTLYCDMDDDFTVVDSHEELFDFLQDFQDYLRHNGQ